MDNQISQILKQHIQWKDYCIDSLKNDNYSDSSLDSTKKAMIKIFQRDKFFLELYLRASKKHEKIFTPKINR